MTELGFSYDQAADLAREIDAGAVLDDIQVHPHDKLLLSSMHTGSWFHVAGSEEVFVFGKGGRQGCRFSGVLSNLAYAKGLKRLYESATEDGIPVRLNYTPGQPPGESSADGSTEERVQETMVFDVTFVDDEAIVITAAVLAPLIRKFRRAAQLLIEAFERYGIQINWKAGKTEAIDVYRGKHARTEKARLCTSGTSRNFSIFPDSSEGVCINTVEQYKHLGSIIAASGSFVPEARQRVKSAMHAFVPLTANIFSSRYIGLQR